MATTHCEEYIHDLGYQIMIFLSELPWTLFVGIFVLSFLERSLTVFVASLGSTLMITILQQALQKFKWYESSCHIPCVKPMSSLDYAEHIRYTKYGPDIATALIIYQVTLNVFCFTVFSEGRQKIRGMTSTFVCIACTVSRVFLGLASTDSAITGAMAGASTAVAWTRLLRVLDRWKPMPCLFSLFIAISRKEFNDETKDKSPCTPLWFWLRFKMHFGFINDLKLRCKAPEEEVVDEKEKPTVQQQTEAVKYVF